MMGTFLGLGAGFLLRGIIDYIFSSRTLARKIDRTTPEYIIEENCSRFKMQGIVFSCISVGCFAVSLILYIKR